MADLKMTSGEVAKYLKLDYPNYDSMAHCLEATLEIVIKRYPDYFDKIKKGTMIYFYNDSEIANTHAKDSTSIVTGIWKYLDGKQRRKLIKTAKVIQSRETKTKASKSKVPPNPAIINNIELKANATNNNTNISINSAYADSKSITDLSVAINNDINLTKEIKQEYQDLLNKIEDNQGENSYAELISQLLNKLANDNILPIPKWIIKAIDKALKIFKK